MNQQSNNCSLFLDKKNLTEKYEELRKYLPASYELETQEFSENDYQSMTWIDYCVRYCTEQNKLDDKPRHFIARYRDREGHWLYSIVRKERKWT